MSSKRQKNQNQLELAFLAEPMGEAQRTEQEGTELLRAKQAPESPAQGYGVLEDILERENLKEALQRVKANQGCPGVDGMTVQQLGDYLKQHWPAI